MAPALAADPRNASLAQPPSKSTFLPQRDSKLIWTAAEQKLVDNAVDLGNLEVTPQRRAELVKQVRGFAEESGLMMLKNFGVSPELVERMHAAAKELFSLPEEETRQLKGNKDFFDPSTGYFSKFSTFNPSLSLQKQAPLPWFREIFRLHAYPEHIKSAENVWPPSEKLPAFQAITEEYFEGMRRAMEFVLGLLLEGLGLPATYIQDKYRELGIDHKDINTPVQIIPEDINHQPAAGLVAHTDPCVCNIDTADVRGLQFFVAGEWLTIPPLSDTILFNIGDDLETISNGRYHSPVHRALTAPEARISHATALGFPDGDTVIGPAEELIDSLHPARYRTRKARDRVRQLGNASLAVSERDRTKKPIFIDFDSDVDKTKNMYVSQGHTLIDGASVGDWGPTMPAAAA